VGSTEIPGTRSIPYRRKTILIADEHELLRTQVRHTLESDTDFEICGEAADGAAAVIKAKELSPDLVILDLSMPRLNGIEAAALIQNAVPGV
jgi:DNA-binding NarL/FixJ family response regulator